mgnify:CR=1 FL=1
MNLFAVMEVSGSALIAERQRAEIVASNLANAETTRTPEGGPYRRMQIIFGARRPQFPAFGMMLAAARDFHVQGVRVEGVVADGSPPVRRYEPGHPDADAQGYVSFPAINPVEEMVDLMGAARAYQLNAAAIQATKAMIQASIEIVR